MPGDRLARAMSAVGRRRAVENEAISATRPSAVRRRNIARWYVETTRQFVEFHALLLTPARGKNEKVWKAGRRRRARRRDMTDVWAESTAMCSGETRGMRVYRLGKDSSRIMRTYPNRSTTLAPAAARDQRSVLTLDSVDVL